MDDKNALLDPSVERELKGHRNEITALAFSPNEKKLASCSLDKSILLWDLDNRGTMRSYRFQGHNEAVLDVTFSPNGKYMASASRDRSVRIWVPTVTGSTGVFKAHSQSVRSVQFSPDCTKILTASDDKIVKLWSSDRYKFISSFVGHTNWVRCARMSSDGSLIASCSDDKTTKLWNPGSGELIHTYQDQKGHGLHLAWHPSSCYIAVATSRGNVKLYDIRTHNLVQFYSIHSEPVTQVGFHPSGSYIITSSKDGKMKILDLLEGHPLFTLTSHTGSVNAVAFSPSGEAFASAGDDKVVFIWKTNFAELANDLKENVEQNTEAIPKYGSQSSKTSVSKGRNQGPRAWYLCYHNNIYPVTTFVHFDEEPNEVQPNANSTMIGSSTDGSRTPFVRINSRRTEDEYDSHMPRHFTHSLKHPVYEVGHISHLPRPPPTRATYTIPSLINKSIETTEFQEEDLYGMIKLKETDVCYTSGTIEWVGRKRSFPINSGFKLLSENHKSGHEPVQKKVKKHVTNNSHVTGNFIGCECADVLPTVNAIVDHLNALHEAVDLVDIRLNTIENVMDT